MSNDFLGFYSAGGSLSRIRTYGRSINSRELYRRAIRECSGAVEGLYIGLEKSRNPFFDGFAYVPPPKLWITLGRQATNCSMVMRSSSACSGSNISVSSRERSMQMSTCATSRTSR